MASIQNLASGVLASDISSSATSLSVNCGEGSSSTLTAVWPPAPFYITVMPAYPTVGVANSLDSEIMLVSALSASDNVVTMTVSRGQRGTTAKAFSEGAIITNGIYTADMDYAQAVGRSFFSATLTNSITGSYTVSDSMLPNTPEDGMSIRVVFGGIQEDTTFPPKLRLNSGSYYNIYAGNNLRSDAGDTATYAMVKSGVIYELTYYNGAWYVLNLVANSSIVSDNIDWATISSAQLAEASGGWVLLGEASSSTAIKYIKVEWSKPYYDLKFVCSSQSTAVGDVYISPKSASGGKLSMSGGVRLGASSDTVVIAQSETWDGNIMVLNQTEEYMSYNIQGQSIRHSSGDWRNWQVWGSQDGVYHRMNFWSGRQNNSTETKALQFETNGYMTNAYLAVWGRCPY